MADKLASIAMDAMENGLADHYNVTTTSWMSSNLSKTTHARKCRPAILHFLARWRLQPSQEPFNVVSNQIKSVQVWPDIDCLVNRRSLVPRFNCAGNHASLGAVHLRFTLSFNFAVCVWWYQQRKYAIEPNRFAHLELCTHRKFRS